VNHLPPRRVVRVVPYDPQWPEQFRLLRDHIWPAVNHLATAIEHVGSTSVPGLAAKPVIDMDIVIPSGTALPPMIAALRTLGYEHRGNLGIEDREAFLAAEDRPKHNLYACPSDSLALRNHLSLRDHLRTHPSDAADYARLKIGLAEKFPGDMDRYIEAKTNFILSILARDGFSTGPLESIRRANQAPK
jgi:GrpB-like predicted nucleotidyltransferase (UPF0157 family)